MDGAFKVVNIQPCCPGSGDGTNSSHGKRMHQYFLTRLGFLTQRKTHNFAQQFATRYYEAFAIDKAEECASVKVMDLADIDKHWKEKDNEDVKDGMEPKMECNYHNKDIPITSNLTHIWVGTRQL